MKKITIKAKFAPRAGQPYYFIGVPTAKTPNLALLVGRRVWNNFEADKSRAAIGNVFPDVKTAKATRDKLVKVLQDANYVAPSYLRSYR